MRIKCPAEKKEKQPALGAEGGDFSKGEVTTTVRRSLLRTSENPRQSRLICYIRQVGSVCQFFTGKDKCKLASEGSFPRGIWG